MDSTEPRNVLLIGHKNEISEGLFEIAVKEIAHGTVLYLSSKPLDQLPELFLRQERYFQKKIIFLYFKSLETLIEKLMDFHNMSLTPRLIIIESLETFFTYQNQKKDLDYFMQGNAKIFSGLQSCIASFCERANGVCRSIVSLDDAHGYYHKNLPTFIDLFYYKKNYCTVTNSNFVAWLNDFITTNLFNK